MNVAPGMISSGGSPNASNQLVQGTLPTSRFATSSQAPFPSVNQLPNLPRIPGVMKQLQQHHQQQQILPPNIPQPGGSSSGTVIHGQRKSEGPVTKKAKL